MTEAPADSLSNALATFEIIADDTPLPPTLQICSVDVTASSANVHQASVVLCGEWSDITVMHLGADVTISAGFAEAAQPIFSGIVTERSATYALDAGPMVTIGCAGTLAPGDAVSLTYGTTILDFAGTVRPVDGVTHCAGTVRSEGRYADLGGSLTLAGIGVPFDDAKTVTSVRHDIRDGNWTTEIGFNEPAAATN